MTQDVVLLTTAEVAAKFRIHPSTLRRWVAEGRLRSVPMPGKDKRFRESDIDAILAAPDIEQIS